MDVRCEKCGTEYELDEARLKPGGVTVKCTNCGHMFKIRKRAPTNVGATPPPEITRPRAQSTGPNRMPSAAPAPERVRAPDSGRVLRDDGGGERLWIIRFDDGSQKQCRELATLQQWIVSGTVTRESMISRTGKTWKRLGDIAELSSFFIVADEARQQRLGRDTGRVTAPVTPAKEPEVVRTTQVGVASGPKPKVTAPREEVTQAAVPRSLADVGSRPKPSPSKEPSPSTTAPMGSQSDPTGVSMTRGGLPPIPTPAGRAPTGAPANQPAKLGALPASPPGATAKAAVPAVAQPTVPATPVARASTPPPTPPGSTPPPIKANMPVAPAAEGRKTGAWANEQIRPHDSSGEWVAADDVQLVDESGAQRGPMGGKIAAIPDEPLFTSANLGAPVARAKAAVDESPFDARMPKPSSAPLAIFEDDDSEPVRVPRGGGKWIAIAALLIAAIAAVAIYFGVIRGHGGSGSGSDTASGSGTATGSGTASGTGTGTAVAAAVVDAAPPPSPPDAAPVAPAQDAIAIARDALLADVTARMDDAQKGLAADETKPGALALEARLIAARAQSLEDQATLQPDKKIAAALHKQAQQKLIDAVHYAQRAQKAQPADVTAAVAMADILRLQGRPARDVQRYLAPGLTAKDRDARLVAALVELRDGKREPARADLEKLDSGDDAMERSGDVRARFRRAMIAFAGGDGATAKQLATDVIGVQPEHEGAKALLARVVEKVASGDPMPNEDHGGSGGGGSGTGTGTGTNSGSGTGPGTGASPVGDVGYSAALAKANQLAEDGNCGAAMEYYQKALSLKATSVEALTGEGYCQLDNKQFASAYSSFRSALAIDSRNERALWGFAQGYQQQGLTQKAIEAYQHYLEVYPDSAAAKKQLEHLGGGASTDSGSGTGSSSGSGSASSAPPPPAPPPPPPDNGSGSASGSASGAGSGTGSASGNDPFGSGSGN